MIVTFLRKTKQFILTIFKLLDNPWVKRLTASILVIYSLYYLYHQYNSIRETLSALTINYPLLALSSLLIIIIFIVSVSSWNSVIAAFGFSYPWIEIARANMLSAIGKYIPGHIWNYSSRIYLSHKLGLPIKISGYIIITELIITYYLAVCLFLTLFPKSIFLEINDTIFLLLRISGFFFLGVLLLSPLILGKHIEFIKQIKYPQKLYLTIFIRAGIWVFSSYAFNLLIKSLGYENAGLPLSIAIITSSFFIGFLTIIAPDGLVVREAIMIYLLRNIIPTAEATILSLVFRFQLVVFEFLIILFILVLWRIRSDQAKPVNP